MQWDWRGLTAVILSAGVSIALAVTLIAAVVSSHMISTEESSLISGVLGAAVGAIATYLGGGYRERNGKGQEDK